MKHRSTSALALCTVIAVATASAQGPALSSSAAFEVASIKPSPEGDPANPLSAVPMASPQPGGRFVAAYLPVWALISTAWELPDFRIVGGNPEVMNSKYNITAKAAGGETLGMKAMLPMLQSLIVERFRLKFHFEPREMSLYDLVPAATASSDPS